jgi:SAM-dependent methyltransferase
VRPTPSPNIWRRPDLYEQLNRAADPQRLVASTLDRLLGSRPSPVGLAVDVGCGTGYHLPMLAARARHVIGVEPHAGLVARAGDRVRRARLDQQVQVRSGVAQRLPAESATVDLVFSYWAYFFGPGCEPGLAEAERVLAPGGLQVAVDLDVGATHGYAAWFAASGSGVRADRTADFFRQQGWQEEPLAVVWSFSDRRVLADVLGIEFPPQVAARALRETVGSSLAVPTVLRWRRVPPRSVGGAV